MRAAAESVDFIKPHKASPFFLYVPFSMPHVPLYCSEAFKGKSIACFSDEHQTVLWNRKYERGTHRGRHAGVRAVTGIVAVGLVIEASVRTLGKGEPPAVGIHQFAEVRGFDIGRQGGVGHAHDR